MTGEVLSRAFRFVQTHPGWSEKDGGDDGWDADVAWWAVATSAGLVLVDPLVHDWTAVDGLVARQGPCAAVRADLLLASQKRC